MDKEDALSVHTVNLFEESGGYPSEPPPAYSYEEPESDKPMSAGIPFQTDLPGIINYRFLTTETHLKALHILCCLFTTSSVKLFLVTIQIFVYKFLFTIMFFWKKKKQHSQNLSHFENESTFRKRLLFLY